MAADENFQATASAQGRSFEDAVAFILKSSGWRIAEIRAIVAGVEVDIIADDSAGRRWWIECKGSFRGNTPGSRRGDTVKKAVGVAWYLSTLPERCPYMLVTSHLPKPETVGARLLDKAVEVGLFDQVNVIGFLAAPDHEEDE